SLLSYLLRCEFVRAWSDFFSLCSVGFFLQAEGGIRFFHVTAVQTCALPIFAVDDAEGKRARPLRAADRGALRHRRPRPPGRCLENGRASCRERGEGPEGVVCGREKRRGLRWSRSKMANVASTTHKASECYEL